MVISRSNTTVCHVFTFIYKSTYNIRIRLFFYDVFIWVNMTYGRSLDISADFTPIVWNSSYQLYCCCSGTVVTVTGQNGLSVKTFAGSCLVVCYGLSYRKGAAKFINRVTSLSRTLTLLFSTFYIAF